MPESATRIVAITGGIGAGKSAVGRMLVERGFLVMDCDQISRELTTAGSPVLEEIRRTLGAEVVSSDGSLDRARVARMVFLDGLKLKRLEAILHPRIVEAYRKRAAESGEKWVFVLAPVLFEAGLEDTVDRIWLCYAPGEVRLARAMTRDSADQDAILARMRKQIPDEVKVSRADFVIDTSESLSEVEKQLTQALETLRDDA